MKKLSISIDFDGTICEEGKFIAPNVIPYPPIAGAREALRELNKHFKIIVFSVRALDEGGKKAIEEWMKKYDIPFSLVTAQKLASVLYVDNRAIRFTGDWMATLRQIASLEVN